MSSEAIRKTVSTFLTSKFAVEQPTVKMFFENSKFTQPKGEPWVYVTIIDADSCRANMGSNIDFKHLGVVNCQVMIPEDSGTSTARQIADSLFAILADRQIPGVGMGSVTFYNVQRRTRGMVNGWYSIAVQAPFRGWSRLSR